MENMSGNFPSQGAYAEGGVRRGFRGRRGSKTHKNAQSAAACGGMRSNRARACTRGQPFLPATKRRKNMLRVTASPSASLGAYNDHNSKSYPQNFMLRSPGFVTSDSFNHPCVWMIHGIYSGERERERRELPRCARANSKRDEKKRSK